MARSTYIYMIECNGEPAAVFTVKREANAWANHQQFFKRDQMRMFRMKDNPSWFDASPPSAVEIPIEWN